MFDKTPDIETGKLAAAAEAWRDSSIRPELLSTAESRIIARFNAKRKNRWARPLIWTTGFAVACVAGLLVLSPKPSYAAEMRQIAFNGDASVHHILTYDVQTDGSLKLALEEFGVGNRRHIFSAEGTQLLIEGRHYIVLRSNGATTIEISKGRHMPVTAAQFITRELSDRSNTDSDVSVARKTDWHGLVVDIYTFDATFHDGRNISHHSHVTLVADPASNRPIEIDSSISGLNSSIQKWDYRSYDPRDFEVSIKDKSRVYDIEAERADILHGLSLPGKKVIVGGKTVELVQLWVDERGEACAIARADYAYPIEYGLQIVGVKSWVAPTKPPFPSAWAISEPWVYKGKPVQFFLAYREGKPGPSNPSGDVYVRTPVFDGRLYPDRVDIVIPVFSGKSLLGYAKFKDVSIHRTLDLMSMLGAMNVPFWDHDVIHWHPANVQP